MGSQPWGGTGQVSPSSSCTCSRAFSWAVWVGAGHSLRGRGTVWHSLAQSGHLQTPTQASGVPSQQHKAPTCPPWVLLFHRCFVSHITDVTSPRHRSSQMDLMSLCFLQLRKTSERLSRRHPEEPAGHCATVPTAGQRAAKGASGSAESSREPGTTSRAPLSSPGPASATLLTGPGR